MLINVTNIYSANYISVLKSHQNLFSPDFLSQSVTQQVFIKFLHVPDTVLGFGNAVAPSYI